MVALGITKKKIFFQRGQTTKNIDCLDTGYSVTSRNTWKCSKDPYHEDIVSKKYWIAFRVS